MDRLGNKVFLILVANKAELYENEEIREEDGKKFAKIINAKFALVTAKEDGPYWNNLLENALKDYIKITKNKWEKMKIILKLFF